MQARQSCLAEPRKLIEIGQRFGMYTVLERIAGSRPILWKCRCDCGNVRNVFQNSLRRNVSRSCGCVKAVKRSWKSSVTIGTTFGLLQTVSYIGPSPRRWHCVCQCGTECTQIEYNLVRGFVTSCGCKQFESKEPAGLVGFRKVLGNYQTNAKKHSRVWDLTEDQFRAIVTSNCHYCNIPPRQVSFSGRLAATRQRSSFLYNGIDRLDNSLGYTLANSVPCCNQCNLSKKNYSLTEFIEWVRRVNAHWNDKCPE